MTEKEKLKKVIDVSGLTRFTISKMENVEKISGEWNTEAQLDNKIANVQALLDKLKNAKTKMATATATGVEL